MTAIEGEQDFDEQGEKKPQMDPWELLGVNDLPPEQLQEKMYEQLAEEGNLGEILNRSLASRTNGFE